MAKLTSEQIFAVIQEAFPDEFVEVGQGVVGDSFAVVKPEKFDEIAKFCHDDSRLDLDLLVCITGIDYPDDDKIEVAYNLESVANKHVATVKVHLPRSRPDVPTVENIWRAADWHERETFDLVGVNFVGHHNLIRILCAEDWVGHPLRKDYVIPETYHGLKNVIY